MYLTNGYAPRGLSGHFMKGGGGQTFHFHFDFKKSTEFNFWRGEGRELFPGTKSLGKMVVSFPMIVINLPWIRSFTKKDIEILIILYKVVRYSQFASSFNPFSLE